MLAVVILSRPLCAVWQFHAENFQGPNAIVIIVSFFINLFSLLACVLLGSKQVRAFVASAFVLSIIYVAEIPVIYYTAALLCSLFTTYSFFDAISKIPQCYHYYLIIFLLNLIVMCSCFLATHWLRKTQEKPALRISVQFCLFFISFTIIMLVFIITVWLLKILSPFPMFYLAYAIIGTLLVCIPHFAIYFYSRLTACKEAVSVKKEETANIQNTSYTGYTQFIGQLSKRELEVIEAVLAGCVSQKELAVTLNISVNTVKKHLQHIYKTTGAANMTALMVLFRGYSPNNP